MQRFREIIDDVTHHLPSEVRFRRREDRPAVLRVYGNEHAGIARERASEVRIEGVIDQVIVALADVAVRLLIPQRVEHCGKRGGVFSIPVRISGSDPGPIS